MINLTIVRLASEDNEEKVLSICGVHSAMSLGRHVTADIKIDATSVSRLHCFVIPTKTGQLRIKDLNSESGTVFNGERISEEILSIGDSFFLGRKYRVDIGHCEGDANYHDIVTLVDEKEKPKKNKRSSK